jgi:hypothetical protein
MKDETRYLERMHKRYGDPLHHHGDCCIYKAGLPVCTCGLLHDLIIMPEEFQKQHYPSFLGDKVKESLWDEAGYDYMDTPVPTLDSGLDSVSLEDFEKMMNSEMNGKLQSNYTSDHKNDD